MQSRERFQDYESSFEARSKLAEWRAKEARREAAMQVFASLPGEAYKPLEDRHTNKELARRVALLERQVDDLQRRLGNAEGELRRLRARPWWRR